MKGPIAALDLGPHAIMSQGYFEKINRKFNIMIYGIHMGQDQNFQRHYGLDWLRIGAFSLLILHHIGMYFVPGNWIVKTDQSVSWPGYAMLFLTPWRLELLFVVSGYASYALYRKLSAPGHFAWMRTMRLIPPLLFGMIILIPPQSWVRLQFWNGYSESYLHFWLHDAFRFGTLNGIELPGWEHLWFISYLWAYTMILVLALALLPKTKQALIRRWFDSLGSGWRLLWVPLAFFIPMRIIMTFTVSEAHGMFDDWHADLIYLPAFLFGFGIAGTHALWPAISRLWKPALLLSMLAFVTMVAIEAAYPGTAMPPHALMALNRSALMVMMWAMVIVLFYGADKLLNRDHALRKPLSEAIFPFYLIHQTIIVLVGWWLIPQNYNNITEFLILFCATAAGCWLFYYLGRKIGWFRPFIGLGLKAARLSL